MKKKAMMVVFLIPAVLLFTLLGCKNETETPKPDVTQAANVSQTPATPEPTQGNESPAFISKHTALLSANKTAMSGGDIIGWSFGLNESGVFFGVEDGVLNAYAEAILHDEPNNLHYELLNPIASFPVVLDKLARVSISNSIRANLNAEFSGDDDLQLFGYIGENYIIFTDEPFHGYQAAAMFVRTDAGEWNEISLPNGYLKQITGGCMLNERVGYICYLDRDLMHSEAFTPRQLTVFRTSDGGKTWVDLMIQIPEEYNDVIAPPTYALSPYFEGEHGIMFVAYSEYNEQSDSFDSRIAWFESTNNGTLWEFHID